MNDAVDPVLGVVTPPNVPESVDNLIPDPVDNLGDIPTRVNVLREAADLIVGSRQNEYGTPTENFQRIADFWSVLFPERQWTREDVARAMIALKLARTVQSTTRDTMVDISGYAALTVELGEVG